MKKIKKYLYGVLLVLLGFILVLDVLELITINVFFDGWWTLFIIIPAMIEIFANEISKNKNKKENYVFLFLGLFLLLICRDVIDISLILNLIIPILLICGGVYLLFTTKVNSAIKEIKANNCNNNFKVMAINENLSYVLENTVFTGMDLEVTKGSINYNLNNAIITDNIVIDCKLFGGDIELSLPQDVNIVVKSLTPTIKIKNNRKIYKNLINQKTVYIKVTGLNGNLTIN